MGAKKLVIVESPTKAKTIGGYLGDEYEVIASVGHIRDLAEPSELPSELKKGAFGRFAVDIEQGFAPFYVVNANKKKTVTELKRALKGADELWLATDEDREGEAIAWHLLEVLNPKVPVRRMVFHEITKEAIAQAQANTRDIDLALVDAQETRRILDRLYGYDISPVLWRKVAPKLSAGRVQSAATRLVVERERERMAFIAAEYWDLQATFEPGQGAVDSATFEAKLVRLNGERLATGSDFNDQGALKPKALQAGVTRLSETRARTLAQALSAAPTAQVRSIETKPYTRKPAPPFTTSTLQQEASRKLRYSSRQTMSLAQSLYENGYITYMRTDSPTLSGQAIAAARAQAAALYGAATVPEAPRVYKGKTKGAQEAHEAIRPAGDTFAPPNELRNKLSKGEFELYELIWKRTIASQMADAKGSTDTVTLTARVREDHVAAPEQAANAVAGRGAGQESELEFTASGTVVTFPGFLLAYEEGKDEKRSQQDEQSIDLPQLTEGQQLGVLEPVAKGHETTPPPRYTEASLTKRLEDLGIGRPSTYAAIISTITDRGYVTKKGQALVPSWIAFSVVRLLEEHFAELVDYDFTAEMEGDLDRIAAGEQDRVSWLHDFYFGSESHPGLRQVVDNLGEIDARAINTIRIDEQIALRNGKYGPYLEVFDEKCEVGDDGALKPRSVNIPEGLAPDELTPQRAHELAAAEPLEDRIVGLHPETGKRIAAKNGRFGPYVTELPDEGEELPKGVKPRTASLFRSMDPATIDLDTAVALLALPRVIGIDAESGEEITAQNGRYGPYLKKGSDTRTLPNEEAIFSIDLAGALELLAQPKYGARRAASALKEFPADPVSGKPIRVRDGRFGPYVTDGETNATIPRGDSVEEITFERAAELLAIKRAKGPAPRRGARSAAKQTAARKTTTKKTTAKKTAAKKPATAKKAVDPVRQAAAKKAAATRKANAAAKAAAAAVAVEETAQ